VSTHVDHQRSHRREPPPGDHRLSGLHVYVTGQVVELLWRRTGTGAPALEDARNDVVTAEAQRGA
jgi:hypothetical protein